MVTTNLDINLKDLGIIDKFRLWQAKRRLFKMLNKVIEENGTVNVFISITGEKPSSIIPKVTVPFETITVNTTLNRQELGQALKYLGKL